MRSCLSTSFYTLTCGGEFTIPSIEGFNPTIHLKHSDVWHQQDHHGFKVTVFNIPHMKCSKDGEDVYFAAQTGLVNPLAELNNQYTINNSPMNAHLFTYHHGNSHRPLAKHAFMNRINAITASLGLESLKGHRIHIGGTLEYLLHGVLFDVVKSMGCWSSEAFMLYLCRHAMIMAPYLQAHPVLETFMHYTMLPIWHC